MLGPEHPDTLKSMNNLAAAYTAQGSYKQAETLASQALETRRRVLGPERRYTLASVDNLASAFAGEGKYRGLRPYSDRTWTPSAVYWVPSIPKLSTGLRPSHPCTKGRASTRSRRPMPHRRWRGAGMARAPRIRIRWHRRRTSHSPPFAGEVRRGPVACARSPGVQPKAAAG